MPDLISTSEAVKLAQTIGIVRPCKSTIINWCNKYNIGYKIGGKWFIRKDQFIKFLHGGENNGKKES